MLKQTYLIAVVGLAFGLGACTHSEPNFIYMPDMVYSPALKAQKQGSMMMPVKGTVPRGFEPYPFPKDEERAGRELKNPVPRSKTILARGQVLFNTYCIVCHGPNGEGDGTIVPKFPRPPSLQSDKVRSFADGRIYHLITVGRNLMPSYASQIAPGDRWAIIHYVRVLQRSKHPTPEDLKIAEQESK